MLRPAGTAAVRRLSGRRLACPLARGPSAGGTPAQQPAGRGGPAGRSASRRRNDWKTRRLPGARRRDHHHAPTELVAGGDALAKIDGFPVFAANVFPGDVARVQLYEVKKGFAKAELVELVTPSPWRRAVPAPSRRVRRLRRTALRLDKQLEAKRRILTESLRRIGKFDVSALPEIALHPRR